MSRLWRRRHSPLSTGLCTVFVQTQPRRYAGAILWRDQHLEDAAYHETAFEHIVVSSRHRPDGRLDARLISGGDISAAVVAAAAEALGAAALGARGHGLPSVLLLKSSGSGLYATRQTQICVQNCSPGLQPLTCTALVQSNFPAV
jgi:hypothetical protein